MRLRFVGQCHERTKQRQGFEMFMKSNALHDSYQLLNLILIRKEKKKNVLNLFLTNKGVLNY